MAASKARVARTAPASSPMAVGADTASRWQCWRCHQPSATWLQPKLAARSDTSCTAADASRSCDISAACQPTSCVSADGPSEVAVSRAVVVQGSGRRLVMANRRVEARRLKSAKNRADLL